MRKDLLYAAGKEAVKDRKRDLYAFFTMSLRKRKFEISCCDRGRGWNCWPQAQAARTRKSLPYLQPSNELRPP